MCLPRHGTDVTIHCEPGLQEEKDLWQEGEGRVGLGSPLLGQGEAKTRGLIPNIAAFFCRIDDISLLRNPTPVSPELPRRLWRGISRLSGIPLPPTGT